jgi:hypothetical protein
VVVDQRRLVPIVFAVTLIVLSVTAMACGRATAPTTPIPPGPNMSGTWSGTISSVMAGNGTLSLTLSERCLSLLPPGVGCEEELLGTWSTSFADSANNRGGTVSGSVSGSSVSLSLYPGLAGTCPLSVTAALLNTVSSVQLTLGMNGSFTTMNCAVADSGTISAIKQ